MEGRERKRTGGRGGRGGEGKEGRAGRSRRKRRGRMRRGRKEVRVKCGIAGLYIYYTKVTGHTP